MGDLIAFPGNDLPEQEPEPEPQSFESWRDELLGNAALVLDGLADLDEEEFWAGLRDYFLELNELVEKRRGS